MTPNQYRAALRRLDLTQVGAARLFGVNEVTSRRWAAKGPTGTVVILLKLLLADKITLADIEAVR
jgi:hypothetical protein